MPQREHVIVARILRVARAHGCIAEKRHGSAFTSRGTPDVCLWIPVTWQRHAVPVVLEVKKPGEVATPLQAYRLAQYAAKGVIARCVTSAKDVEDLIESMQRGGANDTPEM